MQTPQLRHAGPRHHPAVPSASRCQPPLFPLTEHLFRPVPALPVPTQLRPHQGEGVYKAKPRWGPAPALHAPWHSSRPSRSLLWFHTGEVKPDPAPSSSGAMGMLPAHSQALPSGLGTCGRASAIAGAASAQPLPDRSCSVFSLIASPISPFRLCSTKPEFQ